MCTRKRPCLARVCSFHVSHGGGIPPQEGSLTSPCRELFLGDSWLSTEVSLLGVDVHGPFKSVTKL